MNKSVDWAWTTCVCPVCGEYRFEHEYDICHVCFWENDGTQYNEPDYWGGANNLSLNDYRKWWKKLNDIIPPLMKKYHISKSNTSHWKFDGLDIPRQHIKEFVNKLTNNNIKIRVSFYNICQRYNYNYYTFHGFPYSKHKDVKTHNDELLDLIFTSEPLEICKKYKLIQIQEILEKSDNILECWETLTPNISVHPNPDIV